ncbi:hypothetical protein, variant [Aphanomyces astaci]|uniref:GRAM domain-containing protein n=1 Tax=Aphanomyces astaci TaxID=112090 RepID=W4FCV6_APHAT|nr:hypothetical protein, variant [Aphanomyces astaci]ETV64729.1 hypothetical protein, variant [Aphanomyces astaci]|eukprot:XP_009845768.1 hypothetical protein, variant [Aphanomyces astaci]
MEADSTETSARAQDTTSCAPVSYQFHLFGAFNAVCSKGKNGVQTCQAISSYLQDRAAHEQFYSKQLAKIQQNVKTEDWAKHVANTWNTFHHTIAAISLEYAEFSNMHTSSIVSGMKACTSQQESQIQRLITEGSKLRTQYVECMNKMSKAKERYDKKCAEAIDTIQSIRRPPAADGTSDKVDIFSKVWDNTAKGLGLGSLERQKQRMASCLEDVVASEDAYVRSVDAMNIQYTSYERQVQENLIAFEVTEEQRLEYIKDLLVRSEKSRNAMMGRVERLISGMREALKSIDVLDDIDDGFTKLLGLKHKEGNDVELQVDISPASITALVLKMQTMTDQGVVFTHTMLNTLVECISAEETLVGALERIHTSYSPLSNEAATLFSSAAPVVFAEGTTLDRGWGAVLMHMQRVAYLHKEFGSLLAEPVSLSLDTMKTEYIETKLKMDDELHHLLASVATDMASHTKLEQKLDAKSKELAVTKASLASNIEKDAMLQRFMESPVDRERKLVVKSDLLQDEVADLKGQVDASGAAMTAKLELRRQDICQIVSLCMKNEKYRLDVKKSSLRSLVKAHEHLVAGLLHASTAVLREVETISPVSDIREFIRQAQVPWQAHEPMIPTLHGNALLATELKTFEKTPQPKLSRALSSLSIRTATIAPTDDSNNKTAALQDKVLAAEAEKEDSFGHSDLQKNFNLPPSEQVVTSFSCALYLNNFPHHGRLFLSQSYLCFAGWRESYVVVPIIEIAIVEKKNTALVVPNGMELTTTTQGKHFFASFIFRDECVQAILQLQQIKKQTQDILAPELTTALSETPSDDPTIAFVPAATTTLDLVEELAILSQDYDTVVDQLVLPFSVDVAFTQFWQPTTFLTTLLESCGETLVNVGRCR